ncbi:MAG: NAD(P)-binding domain-containing protein [Alphaproteobacteria bacterium]
MTDALAILEAEIARDLAYIDFPPKDWVRPRSHPSGRPVLDVAIEGAGMQGLAIAFALRRARIGNILAIDESPQGREGPWTTYARMPNLRTPKGFVGLDLGLPSLSVERWYDARFGAGAWDAIQRIPKHHWMEYLNWYRRILDIPVANDTRLLQIRPEDGLLRLDLDRGGRQDTVYARKLIRASGIAGAGHPRIPAAISDGLPRDRYAHTADAIDFKALAGKRVAVLGAGTSAFDNASTALEAGAKRVDMLMRRDRLSDVTIVYAMYSFGFLRHYADLDDARRWAVMQHASRFTPPPPPETVQRAERHANFHLRPRTEVMAAHLTDDAVTLDTGQGPLETDFVICGTGFGVDLQRRPELADIAGDIALWRDRYTPPAGQRDDALAAHPYLGPHFEYTARDPERSPWVGNIHEYSAGSVLSMGPICVGLNGLPFGTARLIEGIARDLFLADADAHVAAVRTVTGAPPAGEDWTI